MQAYTRKYQYDKMGNVLQVKQQGSNGFTRNFEYFTDVNTLEKISDINDVLIEDFTYDSCGNQLTAGASRHYIWTAANRLLVYKNQTGSSDPTIFAQYDYDGAGNRVSKLVRTGSGSPTYTRTIYIDGIFEYHILENGTTYKKNYVYIMDDQSRIAMVRVGDQFPDDISESITYNLENQIKSSSARLDTNGTIIDREEFYPFGDSSLRTFTKKRYRYVGKEKDLESGLYYYGARYYSAWTCRFISVDALAKKYNQLTPYQNAGNNPINDRDIDGNQGEKTSVPNTGSDSSIESEIQDIEIQQPDNLNIGVQLPIEYSKSNNLYETKPLEPSWRLPELTGSGDRSGVVGHGVLLTNPEATDTDAAAIEGQPVESLDVMGLSYLLGRVPGPKDPSSTFFEDISDAMGSASEVSNELPRAQSELDQFVDYVSEKVSSLYNAAQAWMNDEQGQQAVDPHVGEAPEVSFDNNVNETVSDSLEITLETKITESRIVNRSRTTFTWRESETVFGVPADTIGGVFQGNPNKKITNVQPK